MRKPAIPCKGCGKRTYNRPRYCDSCKRPRKLDSRASAWKRGYDNHHKRWREAVGARDDYVCQACGQPAGKSFHADHIVAINQGGERFALSNGQTLCQACHGAKSGRGE